MHNCIWNNVVFQPCRDSFRATLTLVCFFYYYFFNKRWDLKRETIQSSTAHFSPCQNVLRSLSAGLRHRFQPCCLVSSITRCISSLYSCAYVCNRSFCRFLFCCCFFVMCTSASRMQDCIRIDARLTFAFCLCLCPVCVEPAMYHH